MRDLQIPKTRPGDRILLCPPAGQGEQDPAVSVAVAMTEAARLAGTAGRWRRAPDSPARPEVRGRPVVFQYMTPDGKEWTGWAVHWHRDRVPPPEQVVVL